ncbi:MAG: VOC family protein [Hyphomicrobiaceae bacterium]
MDQRVTLITLGVKDVARARAFYERIGWKASSESNPQVVFFQAGSTVFGLFGQDMLAAESGIAGTPRPGGVSLACNMRTRDEVDATLAEVEAAGATITRQAAETPWGGYVGYFTDPDGHPWEVTHAPMLEMNDDGFLVMPD